MRHLLTTVLVLPLAVAAQTPTPTWSADIACIVFSHCAPCHREGGAGHFPLTSFVEAFPYRNDIRDATQLRLMPPWPPDEDYRSLAHERLLTPDEVDLIAAWVNGGAPEGDPNLAPPPPVFASDWVIAQPDITARMEEYVVPPSSNDNYRCFVLPINNPTDRFITGFEVVPGNTAVVHHVLVFTDETGQAAQLDAGDPEPGYASFGGIGVSGAKLVGEWVPGADPYFTPPGMGLPLPANADLVIQVHYPAGSTFALDSTRVNLQLSPGGFVREMALDPILEHGATLIDGPLVIPPNVVKTFHNQYTVPIPATITAIGPHAHLLCTRMKAYAVLPGNDTLPLIDIPEWDFRWQGLYAFREPIFLPTGTVLHGEATYDNTTANPDNPNVPPQWVTLGEATTDEMMLFYFGWTFGFASDTLIMVDTTAHAAHHLDCEPSTPVGLPDRAELADPLVHPVPADDQVLLSGLAGPGTLELRDAAGRLCGRWSVRGHAHALDLQNVKSGAYVALLRDERGQVVQRVRVLKR